MKSNKHIYIHNPCTLQWDDLAGHGCTRFCSKCKNEVHDLTNQDDDAIKTLMINKKGKICARISDVQVQGIFRSNTSNIAKACMVFFFGLTLMGKASAKTDTFHSILGPETNHEFPLEHFSPIDSAGVISGVVKDKEDQRPLEGVTIKLKGNSLETKTDEKGVFKLNVDKEKLKSYTIIVNAVGYQSLETNVKNDQSVLIVLEPEVIWIGEVILPWYQKIWWTIKAPFNKKT